MEKQISQKSILLEQSHALIKALETIIDLSSRIDKIEATLKKFEDNSSSKIFEDSSDQYIPQKNTDRLSGGDL